MRHHMRAAAHTLSRARRQQQHALNAGPPLSTHHCPPARRCGTPARRSSASPPWRSASAHNDPRAQAPTAAAAAAGMAQQQDHQHPVTVLTAFFQQQQQQHASSGSVSFVFATLCTDASPEAPQTRFVCTLRTPRVGLSDGGGGVRCVLEEQEFQGEGRKKADAKRDAAANALAFLQQQPLWEAQQRLPPLQDVLAACFSNEGLQNDGELRAFWTFCQQHQHSGEGDAAADRVLLPLTALAHSKHLAHWLQQQQQQAQQGNAPAASLDVPELMRRTRVLLQEQAAAGSLPPGVGVEDGGLCVSRQQVLHAPSSSSSDDTGRLAELQHEVWEEAPTAVLVPADVRQPVQEFCLQSPAAAPTAAAAPSSLLHQVASALGLGDRPQSLVVWGRVGPRVSHAALPQQWQQQQEHWRRVHGGDGSGGEGGSSTAMAASAGSGAAGSAPVLLGVSRQASAGPAASQPPLKRAHKDDAAEQGQQSPGERGAQLAAADGPFGGGGSGASDPASSLVSLLQQGGGPAAMDWQGAQSGDAEVKGPAASAAQQQQAQTVLPPAMHATAPAAARSSRHTVDIGPPAVYACFHEHQGSEAAGAGLNLRASWLSGRRVYGPAVFAGSGIMRGAGTFHVIKWRSYSSSTFWAAVSGLFPAAVHAARAAPGGLLLAGLPTEYRPSCWSGDSAKHLLASYAARNRSWVAALQRQEQPEVQPEVPLLGWTLAVEDASEPAANSPTGFNARARVRVQPVAAAAAAAAAVASSSSGERPGWLQALGCSSAGEATLLLEGLRVSVDTPAGAAAAAAHVEVQDGRLLVVADSGPSLGPLGAENSAALAALHLLAVLDAAALTGSRPQAPRGMAHEAAGAGLGARAAAGAPGADAAVAGVGGGDALMTEAGSTPADGAGGVQLLWPGAASGHGSMAPAAGLVAKIDAHLFLPPAAAAGPDASNASSSSSPSDPACYTLDALRGFSYLVGSGTVQPALEEMVMGLTPGGAAQRSIALPLEGLDVLHKFTPVRATLAVQLLEVGPPKRCTAAAAAGGSCGAGNGSIFDPPLGLQRRRLVSELIKAGGSSTVVDLGCGDGGLLKHLLCDCGFSALKRLVGIDVSTKELAAAARRLQGMANSWVALEPAAAASEAANAQPADEGEGSSLTGAALQAGGAHSMLQQLSIAGPQGQPAAAADSTGSAWEVTLQLLQGDLTHPGLAQPSSGLWHAAGLSPGGAVGLAACLEVLEHLEPSAVDALGHSVLGGLQPAAAVFSTPDWAYNFVLRAINKGVMWPGPPGRDGQPLRHGGHVFEWTRAEFRAWSSSMAAQHGYSVEFVGIGHALQEAEAVAALQDQQQQQGEASLGSAMASSFGAATQAAIFRRLSQGRTTAAAAAGQQPGADSSDGGLRRVWGPVSIVTRVGSLRSDAGQELGVMDAEVEHF